VTALAEFHQPSVVDAAAARYTAMGEFYTAQAEARQQAIEADAARLSGLAEFHQSSGMEVNAARLTGLAEYYLGNK
jgi:hypothetical protein